MDEDFSFEVFFEEELSAIETVENFRLRTIINKNEAMIKAYLKMFKIEGRYKQHKDEILKMLKLRVNYSDEKITEVANQTRISKLEIKKLIFGNDIFIENYKDIPIIKLKRDIAIRLKIIT